MVQGRLRKSHTLIVKQDHKNRRKRKKGHTQCEEQYKKAADPKFDVEGSTFPVLASSLNFSLGDGNAQPRPVRGEA